MTGCMIMAFQAAAKRGEKVQQVLLNNRELATVLASLRMWQASTLAQQAMYHDHFEDLEQGGLSENEIDQLCEQLNCGKAGA